MKKFLLSSFLFLSLLAAKAQTADSLQNAGSPVAAKKAKKDYSKLDLANRSNDHFMFQYGVDSWSGTNDSAAPKGFSRFFNAYVMLDKPFRNNPNFSVGLGVGLGSSNMFFKNTYVDVKSTSARLPFRGVDTADHFKKFKLTTIFLEAPIELRYSSTPDQNNTSIKAALGVKVGTLLTAYTKGKTLLDRNGNTINSFIEKESSKRFFNSTRLALTARVGYGAFSLYGAFQVNRMLRDGAGPDVRPYSIGLAISGL